MVALVLERKQSRCGRWIVGVFNGAHKTQQLLAHNAKVYLAARDAQKADEAIAELMNETGKEAIFLQLDLSDILAVRRSAQEFLAYVLCPPSSSRLTRQAFSGRRVNCTSLSTTRGYRMVVDYILQLIDWWH